MARIVKHSDPEVESFDSYERELLESAIVNLDEEHADEIVAIDPEAERAEILAAAREEAESKVREAFDEGYRRGEERGIEEFTARVADAAAVFEEAAHGIRAAREAFLENLEPQVVQIARAVAERVVLRECHTDPDLIARVAREALTQLADAQSVSIIVNPEDAAVVREHRAELIEEFERIETIHVQESAAIERGGCRVEAESRVVDASLASMIARTLEALDG